MNPKQDRKEEHLKYLLKSSVRSQGDKMEGLSTLLIAEETFHSFFVVGGNGDIG